MPRLKDHSKNKKNTIIHFAMMGKEDGLFKKIVTNPDDESFFSFEYSYRDGKNIYDIIIIEELPEDGKKGDILDGWEGGVMDFMHDKITIIRRYPHIFYIYEDGVDNPIDMVNKISLCKTNGCNLPWGKAFNKNMLKQGAVVAKRTPGINKWSLNLSQNFDAAIVDYMPSFAILGIGNDKGDVFTALGLDYHKLDAVFPYFAKLKNIEEKKIRSLK